MGDKKAKKPKGGDGEDDSTAQLLKIYKKKCEVTNGHLPNKLFKARIDAALEEDEHLDKVHLWEEMGPVGVRSMADSFTEINYQHLKQLRLWKVGAGDEGVRTICNYMMKAKTIEYLDLLDNQIGLLGCEFLSNVLQPGADVPLKRLKLDHNGFGTEGLGIISDGLVKNKTIEKISLCHCGIDTEGVKYFQQLLANVDSQLIKLKIQGNALKNEGVFELFRAFQFNTVLEKVNIADNQFDLKDPEQKQWPLIDIMTDVLKNTTNIIYFDFRFNGMGDEDGYKIIECVEQNKTLYRVECSDMLSQSILEKIKALTKKRKPKKKKKGKGKKGKKK